MSKSKSRTGNSAAIRSGIHNPFWKSDELKKLDLRAKPIAGNPKRVVMMADEYGLHLVDDIAIINAGEFSADESYENVLIFIKKGISSDDLKQLLLETQK